MSQTSTLFQARDSEEPHLVMVVDDLPPNLAFLNEALQTFGYRTATASNGRMALDLAREIIPDLIVSDVNMPEMDGYELIKAVQKDASLRDIPILLVTAQDDRDALALGLDIGADDFLIKPVNLSEMQSRVRNLLLVKDYREYQKQYTDELEARVLERTEALNRAFEELKDVNLLLKTSTLDTIRRLSTAAEYRDRDTAAHIWRMSHYSHVIARAVGLSQEEAENLLYASPMHDVGKIGTPDKILLKAGQFTDHEREIMKAHTTIGVSILDGSDHPLINLAKEVAGGHHERWDGAGYPLGLSGEELPISTRIVAVADVFDALTSPRVYKPAWEVDRAMAYIADQSGTHFDPHCAEAFLDLKGDILDIMQSHHAAEPATE